MPNAVILHLSDIHRTRDEPVGNDEIIHGLLGDLDRYDAEGIPKPNCVVISGDLTQTAAVPEYEEAHAFVSQLLGHLKLDISKLLIVPGNHDIDWAACVRNFQLRPDPPAEVDRALCVPYSGSDMLCPASSDAFEARLDNFRAFYRRLFGRDYPERRPDQYEIVPWDDLGVRVAGFSSCDTISHKKFRGSINISAIANAAINLQDYTGLAIAVWHHDLDWRGEGCQDTLDQGSLLQLSTRAFRLGLCGHTHRPEAHDVTHLRGLPMPVVAAGSLCAGARQRPESVPRSYNVLEVRDGAVRVHVRQKAERASPWGCKPIQNEKLAFERWYEIQLPERARGSLPAAEAPPKDVSRSAKFDAVQTIGTSAKAPTPFAAVNAKAATRREVARQYVWTDVADALDSDMPQIVLGPRGAGKTALLLSLTFESRVLSPRTKGTPADVLGRLGLMCSMNVGEITAFNSKGWLERDERKSLFAATLGTIWAQELVHTLEQCSPWMESHSIPFPTESDVCALLSRMLCTDTEHTTYSALSQWIKGIRSQLILGIGIRDDARRASHLAATLRHPIVRGSPGLLTDIGGELARYQPIAKTRWILLFDEVEYLNEWQQETVYDFLQDSSHVVVSKVATLPYAHARALESRENKLVEGSDFGELALNLTADLEFQGTDDQASQKFSDLALQLWRNRITAAGFPSMELSAVWPDATYESVLSTVTGETVTRDQLEAALIADLTPESRPRAEQMLRENRKEFLNQYWRKYSQPFRVRYANSVEKETHLSVPLVWGWRNMLRACDGNCRWFLRLADECWSAHWAREGMRSMSPTEQYDALRRWAGTVYRIVGNMTKEGPDLKDVVDKAASDLRARLTGLPHLAPEALSFQAKDLSQAQAEAIAVGVALGYLVPRVIEHEQLQFYPTKDVELRLGFPIAIEKRLPLRNGAVLKIGDLKQVAFPWLRD